MDNYFSSQRRAQVSDLDLHNNMTATTKREFDDDDSARVKRVKVEANGDGKTANPYLAHWNDEKPAMKSENGGGRGLEGFKRHATTTKQASVAEDGPNNAFTGRPLSSKYMSILKTRRDLPVHQQRCVYIIMYIVRV